jgi:phage-related protein
MNVHTYQTAGGKDLIFDYLDSLPKSERAKGYVILDRLEREGTEALKTLYTKPIDKKLWEIKFGDNRILYVLVDKDNIYLLHAFRKQKNKTEKFEREKAIKRAKQI